MTRSLASALLIAVSMVLAYEISSQGSVGEHPAIRLALVAGALILAAAMLAASWRLRLVQSSGRR